jgi:hypothetical protein
VPCRSVGAFKPFQTVYFANPSQWREKRCLKEPILLPFAEKSKGPAMKDKTCRIGYVLEQKDIDLQRACPQLTALFPNSVNSAFLPHSGFIVFGYFWCIIGGVGGREMGRIILVTIWGLSGEMVKQWKEQLTNYLVLHPEYSTFSTNFTGTINEDCTNCLKVVNF